MEEITFNHYLIPAIAVFLTGLLGALCRRNAIIVFMCIELMLCGAMLAIVSFASFFNSLDGAVFAFFIMAVAAAEVSVGLAIIVQLFKIKGTVKLDKYQSLGD